MMTTVEPSQLIGNGWAFPIATDATGSIQLVSEVRDLERSMWLILATTPGERPMRPEFGCRLADFVFAPMNATTAGLIEHEVRASLERWEPRVAVEDVQVTPDPESSNAGARIWIEIVYRIVDTYDRRNLVFPFYVIPEHH
jgi:phage baseplate assembly protein W